MFILEYEYISALAFVPSGWNDICWRVPWDLATHPYIHPFTFITIPLPPPHCQYIVSIHAYSCIPNKIFGGSAKIQGVPKEIILTLNIMYRTKSLDLTKV